MKINKPSQTQRKNEDILLLNHKKHFVYIQKPKIYKNPIYLHLTPKIMLPKYIHTLKPLNFKDRQAIHKETAIKYYYYSLQIPFSPSSPLIHSIPLPIPSHQIPLIPIIHLSTSQSKVNSDTRPAQAINKKTPTEKN